MYLVCLTGKIGIVRVVVLKLRITFGTLFMSPNEIFLGERPLDALDESRASFLDVGTRGCQVPPYLGLLTHLIPQDGY